MTINWRGAWSASVSYATGDGVIYGGGAFAAAQASTNQAPAAASAYWSSAVLPATYRGDYAVGTSYAAGDVVRFGASTYQLVVNTSVGDDPVTNTGSVWQTLYAGSAASGAWNSLGSWNPTTSYSVNAVVVDQGFIWLCLIANTNAEPSSSNADWQLIGQQGSDGSVGLSVTSTGAIPDGRIITDLVTASGSAIVSSASAKFTSADIGKIIKYADLSAYRRGDLTTIASVQSATQATLNHAAPVTIPSGNIGYACLGHDQSAAIQQALNRVGSAVSGPFVSFEIPYGQGQGIVSLPRGIDGACYLIASQLVVPTGVVLDGEAMIFSALSNDPADRTPCLYLKPGASILRARVFAGWGMGVRLGDDNTQSHGSIDDLAVWGVGGNYNAALAENHQIGIDLRGYDWTANRLWAKTTGLNGDTGGINVRIYQGSDMTISKIFAIAGNIGLQLWGSEQITIEAVELDTLKYCGMALDACNNVTIGLAQHFQNYDTTHGLATTYSVQIGLWNAYHSHSIRLRCSASVTGARSPMSRMSIIAGWICSARTARNTPTRRAFRRSVRRCVTVRIFRGSALSTRYWMTASLRSRQRRAARWLDRYGCGRGMP